MVPSPTLFLQPGNSKPRPAHLLPTHRICLAAFRTGRGGAGWLPSFFPAGPCPSAPSTTGPLSSTLSDPFSIRPSCNRVLSDLHLCPLKPSTRAHTRSMTPAEGGTQRWNTSVV